MTNAAPSGSFSVRSSSIGSKKRAFTVLSGISIGYADFAAQRLNFTIIEQPYRGFVSLEAR